MARILITSALPYINGVKHLGNLVGSMLPADVYARFRRARGDDVLFLCATDEHGTPAELAARAAGQTVEAYCAEQHEIQKKACAEFGLSFDHFGRSSNPPNHRLTQHFAEVLEKKGLVEERLDRQIYSIDDQRFLPDRYVEGTCPHCRYEKARGDQCDNCGRLLDPVDLIDPYSSISGSRNVEMRETRHLYLLQSKMQSQIADWIASKPEWPHLTKAIAGKWVKEGLQDRSITRDLYWGIPVTLGGKPRPGFEHKVYYVWFDAPIEYIACTEEWAQAGAGRDWRSWWRLDEGAEDVCYVQFMGKDNVAFHTVSFPVTILGSGEPWKTVDTLKSLNWLTWYGGKLSTSHNRGIFMDQALELLPADYWRWHLMANAPESDDASFTLEHFASVVNKDLADVLGNFVNRITRFCASKWGEQVPDGRYGEIERRLATALDEKIDAYAAALDAMEFRKAFVELRGIWVAGNEYLQTAAPWTAFKTDPDRAAAAVRAGLNLIALFAALSAPVIPHAAAKMLAIFGLDPAIAGGWPTSAAAALDRLKPGRPFKLPEVLFKKIEDAQVEAWRAKFGAE
jgi:methionyl-tRNA synthetase